jgi:hypothetical protein
MRGTLATLLIDDLALVPKVSQAPPWIGMDAVNTMFENKKTVHANGRDQKHRSMQIDPHL